MAKAVAGKRLKCPAPPGIKRGAWFFVWGKIGGEMQLISVMCKGKPYLVKFRNGKTAHYVDVFGWGISTSVNITKLLEVVPDEQTRRGGE